MRHHSFGWPFFTSLIGLVSPLSPTLVQVTRGGGSPPTLQPSSRSPPTMATCSVLGLEMKYGFSAIVGTLYCWHVTCHTWHTPCYSWHVSRVTWRVSQYCSSPCTPRVTVGDSRTPAMFSARHWYWPKCFLVTEPITRLPPSILKQKRAMIIKNTIVNLQQFV